MLPSELIKYKEKSQKISATAWDSISSIAEQADVDIVLMEFIAMVCWDTNPHYRYLENIIYHTNAVSRGLKKN